MMQASRHLHELGLYFAEKWGVGPPSTGQEEGLKGVATVATPSGRSPKGRTGL